MKRRETYKVADYPAYQIVRIEKITGPFSADLQTPHYILKDGDELALDSGSVKHGHHYQIGSVISSALERGDDPFEAIERATKNGHELHFIFGLGSSITSQTRDRKTYIEVSHGDIVRFEGKYFTIEKAPNQNLHLEPFID